MAKVTSKLQVTLPKSIAVQYQIRPGDDIEWEAAGEAIRVIPAGRLAASGDRASRLRWFDLATRRQRKRSGLSEQETSSRGWRREDLYGRGRAG